MARTKRIGGGESVEYVAAKFTRYSSAMIGKFKELLPGYLALRCPTGETFLEAYSGFVQVYESIGQLETGYGKVHMSDGELALKRKQEQLIELFLTDADYCGLSSKDCRKNLRTNGKHVAKCDNCRERSIVRDLTPNGSSLVNMIRYLDSEE